MRSTVRSLLLRSFFAALTVQSVLALVPLERGRIVGNASARLEYDSNIFLTNSEVEDVVGTALAELRYVRDAGSTTLDAGVGVNAQTFADHSEQNTADPYFNARLARARSDKTEAVLNLDVRRATIANETVNARTESTDVAVSGVFQHLPTEKLGYRLLGEYSRSDFATAGYSDIQSHVIGADVVHQYSPKLKLLAGAAVGESRSSGMGARRAVRTSDVRYTIGAQGELAPKITGDATVGLIQRRFKGVSLGDTTSLFVDAKLHWAEAEKRTWTLAVSQDFGVTAADQASRNLQALLTMNQALSEKLTLTLTTGYIRANYTSIVGPGGRSDRGATVRGRLAYAIRENLSVEVAAGYRDNNSTLRLSDYSRFTASVGATLRF